MGGEIAASSEQAVLGVDGEDMGGGIRRMDAVGENSMGGSGERDVESRWGTLQTGWVSMEGEDAIDVDSLRWA